MYSINISLLLFSDKYRRVATIVTRMTLPLFYSQAMPMIIMQLYKYKIYF